MAQLREKKFQKKNKKEQHVSEVKIPAQPP
jgi:hypothetical protein